MRGVRPFLQHQAYMIDRLTRYKNRISNIDIKLDDMRQRYKLASPAMRLFLISGAKLLKSQKKAMEKALENQDDPKLF